ncbi:MAG TPA: enoyl-CoA hydratase-related protein [Thermoanaerobaculia bacterium]|nr:enoyl-CoA hydratase-related protein [Thermoanaerobaculia bacterium]
MTHILTAIDGAVGTITIDRPQRFNSLDVETARDLRKAGIQLARDENVRAVVLRGTNGVFCSGADLKYIRAGGEGDDLGYLLPVAGSRLPAETDPTTDNSQQTASYGAVFKQILEYIHSTISEIRRAPKAFIAAVDGIAAAGGFGLAMSCDLVIASERATFEWAYAKTGLTGAESSTFMLPKLIGLRRAYELLFLNPRLSASQAMEIGLITMVVPAETFDAGVRRVAQQIASGPTEALGIAKEMLNEAAGMDRLDYHLDRELENLARIADGSNFAEGIEAFFGKRPAQFGAK